MADLTQLSANGLLPIQLIAAGRSCNRPQRRRNPIDSVLELMLTASVAAGPSQSLQADSSLLSRKSYRFTAVTGWSILSRRAFFKINFIRRAVAFRRWPYIGSEDAGRPEPKQGPAPKGFQFA